MSFTSIIILLFSTQKRTIRPSALFPFTICSTRHCSREGVLMAPTLPTRMLNWSLGLNETHARYASDVNRVTSWRGSDRDRVFFLFFFFPPLSTDVRLVDTPTCGNPFWTACWRPRARSIVDCTVHCRLKKTFFFFASDLLNPARAHDLWFYNYIQQESHSKASSTTTVNKKVRRDSHTKRHLDKDRRCY